MDVLEINVKAKPKEDMEPWFVGDILHKAPYGYWIIAQVGPNEAMFISLSSGNRWNGVPTKLKGTTVGEIFRLQWTGDKDGFVKVNKDIVFK